MPAWHFCQSRHHPEALGIQSILDGNGVAFLLVSLGPSVSQHSLSKPFQTFCRNCFNYSSRDICYILNASLRPPLILCENSFLRLLVVTGSLCSSSIPRLHTHDYNLINSRLVLFLRQSTGLSN